MSRLSSFLQTYKNHILYSSVYAGIITSFLINNKSRGEDKNTTSTSSSSSSSLVKTILSHVGFVISSLCLYKELQYVWIRRKLPPGDSGYPIVGNIGSFLNDPKQFLDTRIQKYGNISTYNLFMRPVIIITTDDDMNFWIIQERKNYCKHDFVPHVRKLVGSECINLQMGLQHRRLRKIIEPTFAPTQLQHYVKCIDQTCLNEFQKWTTTTTSTESSSDKEDYYQPSTVWSNLTMKLFFMIAFFDNNNNNNNGDKGEEEEGGGVSGDEGMDMDQQLDTLHGLFKNILDGLVSIIPFEIPGFGAYGKAMKSKRELSSILLQMVNEFKLKNPEDSDQGKNSMMGRLCYGKDDDQNNGGQTMSDQELIENIIFILFAGYDTIKGSFCAFVHYLTEYPDIQSKLVDEIESFKSLNSSQLDMDELKSEAPLLNAFMAEVWRLVPPLSGHQMEVIVDEIKYKDYIVPKGSMIMLDIQHHSTTDTTNGNGRYKDPYGFRLERWLPPNHPMYNSEYYQDGIDYNIMNVKYRPFNFGRHMCLGGHFAKLEARIILTRLLQNYDFEIKNDELIKFPLRQYRNDIKLIPKKKKM